MGALDPNNIHVPGAFVHRVVQGPKYEKRIEVRRSVQASVSFEPTPWLTTKRSMHVRYCAGFVATAPDSLAGLRCGAGRRRQGKEDQRRGRQEARAHRAPRRQGIPGALAHQTNMPGSESDAYVEMAVLGFGWLVASTRTANMVLAVGQRALIAGVKES